MKKCTLINDAKRVIGTCLVAGLVLSGNFSAPLAEAQDADFSAKMDAYLQNDANVEKIGNSLERFFMKKRQDQMAAQRKQVEDRTEAQFKNPVKIDVGTSPVKGPDNAPITIVEFSDFQCPFCKRGANVMDEVMKAYPGKIKLAFKNLPLVDIHPEAIPAARAALAAHQQGKFWEMHDALFQNQGELGAPLYEKLAQQIGLDMAKFKAAMANDAKIDEQIRADRAAGETYQVRGTPGFFVNGVLVSGAQPLQNFRSIIDRWLTQRGK